MEPIEDLEHQAVDAAVNFNWQNAVDLNKQIIQQENNNLSAYLRLGFALLQLQKYDPAKKIYQKALRLQPNNIVAKENLERIMILRTRRIKKAIGQPTQFNPNLFLDIPGKTKSVALVNLGQKSALAHLTVGQEVFLKPKKRKVEIRTGTNEYIGSLPDDLSKRLMFFLKAKSKYRVFIKEANLNKTKVFIREEHKRKKVANYLSFPQKMQSNMNDILSDRDQEEENEDVTESDLENLAEKLTTEDREYLPYQTETEDEESDE